MAQTGAEKARLWRARQKGEVPKATFRQCSCCGALRKDARINPLHGDLCARCWRKSPVGKDMERARIRAVAQKRAAKKYVERFYVAAQELQSPAIKKLLLQSGKVNDLYSLLNELEHYVSLHHPLACRLPAPPHQPLSQRIT